MALLLEGEKAAKAAQAHMGLCMDQLFDMLMVLRGYADEQGDGAEAEKYRRIALDFADVFRRNDPRAFAEDPTYRWLREESAKL